MIPSIHIENLSLRFGDGTPLFDSLSLTCEAGQSTCILGPSGCGKSTLLRLISGARGYSLTGTVCFAPNLEPASACAWMGQDDLLLPWLNLLDNVLLGAKLRGETTAEQERTARDLVFQAGLAGYERSLPAALSGGMRQRTALLRTLSEARPVLLMDEPFSALDALTRLKLQNLSSRLTRGRTVLLVTHDPLEALRMADRIVVLGGAPVRVQMELALGGSPPRRPDDPEIKNNYGNLVAKLLEESGS